MRNKYLYENRNPSNILSCYIFVDVDIKQNIYILNYICNYELKSLFAQLSQIIE